MIKYTLWAGSMDDVCRRVVATAMGSAAGDKLMAAALAHEYRVRSRGRSARRWYFHVSYSRI